MNTTLWKSLPLEKCIAQLIDFRGKTPKKIGMEWGGGNIKALSANNVKQGYIAFDKECYVGSQDLYDAWMTKGDCSKGDIVFTMEAPLGNVALIPDNNKYILSQRVILLKPNALVDSHYLYHYMSSEKFQNELFINATGSTAKGIKQSRLININITLPPKKWQVNIAEILTNVDKKIDLIEQKITTTKNLKIGLVQKLFSEGIGIEAEDGKWIRHKKFKDSILGSIPQNWEIVSLKEILDVIKDGAHFSPKSSDGQYKYITSKNIRFGKLDLTNISYIDEEEHNKIYKGSPVKPGDILLTKDGANTGNAAINNLEEPFSLLSSVAYLRGSKNKISHTYLLQFLLSSKGQSMMKSAMTGQAITRLTLKKIGDFKIPYPNIIEQKQIAEILSTIDEKLNILEKQRSETQLLKKGLMQKLLTGEWRVPLDCDEDEAA